MFTFREVLQSDAQMLLTWRTSPRVTTSMNTDVDNTLRQQENWILNCNKKPSYYHWVIQAGDQPIGLIYLQDFQPEEGSCSWGFYLGDDNYSGLGGLVPPFFYNTLFQYFGIKIVNAEVWVENESVIRLHQLHGYRFRPDRDRVIEKNGKERLLVSMELQRCSYDMVRFGRFQAHFPILNWAARPKIIGPNYG